MNSSFKDQRTGPVDSVLMVCMILGVGFVTAIIAPDLIDYKPVPFGNTVGAVTTGNITYIVYQDYRNVYSAINMIEKKSLSYTMVFHSLVSPRKDCIRPGIYLYEPNLVISWIELEGSKGTFCQGFWNIVNNRFATGPRTALPTNPLDTRYSFDGQNFTLACYEKDHLDIFGVDIAGNLQATRTTPLVGILTALSVNGNQTCFAVRNGTYSDIYQIDGDGQHQIYRAAGKVASLTGWDGNTVWLARNGIGGWGYLGFYNGRDIISIQVNGTAKNPIVLQDRDGLYISWQEWMRADWNDRENYEVRLAFISNMSDPTIDRIGTVSWWDGFASYNAVLSNESGENRITWFDRFDTAIWSASLNESGPIHRYLFYQNGNSFNIIGFAATFLTSFGVLGLFLYVAQAAIRDGEPVLQHRPEKRSRFEMFRHDPEYSFEFVRFHKKENYLFLKFWLLILPFVFMAVAMMYYADTPGLSLESRMGFGAVVGNAAVFLFCLFAVLKLRDEKSASIAHRVGLGLLAIGAFSGSAGLMVFLECSALEPFGAMILVQSLYYVGQVLAILGATTVLHGLTTKKVFFLLPVISLSIICAFIIIILSIPSLHLFPEVNSPEDLIYEGMLAPSTFSNLFIGMLGAFILFRFLSPENVKPLREWTCRDFSSMRRHGIFIGLLAMLPLSALSINRAMMTPFPDIGDFQKTALVIAGSLLMAMMSFGGVRMGTNRPFGSLYANVVSSYVMCAMTGVAMFFGVLVLGIFGFAFLAVYTVPFYLVDRWVRTLSPENIMQIPLKE